MKNCKKLSMDERQIEKEKQALVRAIMIYEYIVASSV